MLFVVAKTTPSWDSTRVEREDAPKYRLVTMPTVRTHPIELVVNVLEGQADVV
jgi:hypothetical protein